MKGIGIVLVALVAAGAALSGCTEKSGATAPAADVSASASIAAVTFDGHVKGVLGQRCGKCHQEQSKGEFSIASLDTVLAGGESGAAVVPGDAQGSRLYQMVSGAPGVKRMPPKGEPLSAADLESIRQWIDSGAK